MKFVIFLNIFYYKNEICKFDSYRGDIVIMQNIPLSDLCVYEQVPPRPKIPVLSRRAELVKRKFIYNWISGGSARSLRRMSKDDFYGFRKVLDQEIRLKYHYYEDDDIRTEIKTEILSIWNALEELIRYFYIKKKNKEYKNKISQ
jgi:hypothetical protein